MLLRNRGLFVCPAAFINISMDIGLLAISSREIQMSLGTGLGPLSPVTGALSGKNARKTCSPYPPQHLRVFHADFLGELAEREPLGVSEALKVVVGGGPHLGNNCDV
jgi:hypothetical protein